MKIKNILLVCLVVIACSFLLPEKNVMSQSSVDGGDIVMMNIQNGKITLVYHKPSNTFLFYGYPSSDLENEGLQLLQIRSLSNDFQMAEIVAETESELVYNKRGYSVEELAQKTKVFLPRLEKTKIKQGGHYRESGRPLKKNK